jgi:hypothetical protein
VGQALHDFKRRLHITLLAKVEQAKTKGEDAGEAVLQVFFFLLK